MRVLTTVVISSIRSDVASDEEKVSISSLVIGSKISNSIVAITKRGKIIDIIIVFVTMSSMFGKLLEDRLLEKRNEPASPEGLLLTALSEQNQQIHIESLQRAQSLHIDLQTGKTQEIPGALLAGAALVADETYRMLHGRSSNSSDQKSYQEYLQLIDTEAVEAMRVIAKQAVHHVLLLEASGGLADVQDLLRAFAYHNRSHGGSDAVVIGKYAGSAAAHLTILTEKAFAAPDSRIGFHTGGYREGAIDRLKAQYPPSKHAEMDRFFESTVRKRSTQRNVDMLVSRLGEERRDEMTALFADAEKKTADTRVIFRGTDLSPHVTLPPEGGHAMTELLEAYQVLDQYLASQKDDHPIRRFAHRLKK